jgi:hypothetical protein
MQRITISDNMEEMIAEIQKENPFLDKPIDVIKIAMNDFYNRYKAKKSPLNVKLDEEENESVESFWSDRKQKPKSKVLTQEEVDKLSYVS